MFTENLYLNIAIISAIVIGVIWSVLWLVCKASDNSTELIFNRIYCYLENLPIGLRPTSAREMIVGGGMAEPIRYSKNLGYLHVDANNNLVDSNNNIVDLAVNRTNEAILLVHGASNVPIHLKSILNHFKNKNTYDIFGSLLRYHGRTIAELANIDNNEVQKQLKDDVEYLLSLGYSKIYCIGHSIGGAYLTNLSLDNAFGANSGRVKLCLYAPFIASNLTWITKLLIYPIVNLKKYLSLSFELGYQPSPETARYWAELNDFYVIPRSVAIAGDVLANGVLSRIQGGATMSNDFAMILMDDDGSVDVGSIKSKIVQKYLDSNDPRQKRVTYIQTGGHHIHVCPGAEQNTFMNALDSSIAAM